MPNLENTTATLVFVHGFISTARCWDPLLARVSADPDLASYRVLRFTYPTEFIEWNPAKRIPAIKQCANALCEFLATECPKGPVFLIGHSMGGLVIQSYLAQQINTGRGADLARIRSVILFATPNRGSTILTTLRSIFSGLRTNDQEQQLRVLNDAIAETSDTIVRSVLSAKAADAHQCPIPFRIFWGLEDDVVPEVSARGPFVESSGLPGGHSEILQPDPKDPRDPRYLALRESVLNPIGHPSIYEIDRFDVTLSVSPALPTATYTIRDVEVPLDIHTDNIALRRIDIAFSAQNRCSIPYEQMYRSENGWVEVLGFTEPNLAPPETQSEYFSTGKRFSYVFTPDREGTFSIMLRVYNGFGAGERSWHNHMRANAHYRRFRFTLDLTAYHVAGYGIAPEPCLFYHPQNIMDHRLCSNRVLASPLPSLPASPDPWLRTWELENLSGGVVDIAWDVTPPASS